MTVMTDRALLAAVDTYDEIHASLLEDARKAELDEHRMVARVIRYKAAIVARAARAEENDPQPVGLRSEGSR